MVRWINVQLLRFDVPTSVILLAVRAAAASNRIQGTGRVVVVAALGVYPRSNSVKVGGAMTTVAPTATTADRILACYLVTWQV
jgi:hypothetical protein